MGGREGLGFVLVRWAKRETIKKVAAHNFGRGTSVEPSVHIVLVNWNNRRDTANCLSSLQNLNYENRAVIVVDNGSQDDSVGRIRDEFPWARIIETGKNSGFACGCNAGIRFALAEGANFVWLLNPDTTVDCGALQALVDKASSDGSIGAVGSAIYFLEDPERLQAWGGGYINFWLGRSRHFLKPVRDDVIDFITGASVLLSREAIEDVGLLDDEFFMYWEDADYCFRLRDAKWRLAVAGQSKIWHKGSASLRGNGAVLDTYFNQSASRFFRKHALVPRLSFGVGASLRLTKRVAVGDWKRARAVWSAYRQASL